LGVLDVVLLDFFVVLDQWYVLQTKLVAGLGCVCSLGGLVVFISLGDCGRCRKIHLNNFVSLIIVGFLSFHVFIVVGWNEVSREADWFSWEKRIECRQH
jgi:hypothetical protein